MSKKVLVTGIGGNVGQGIIRNLRSVNKDLIVYGSNVLDFSAGNHLCDKVFLLPFAYDENYIEEVKKIVETEGIDLIIPATDYEVYYLSKHKVQLNCTVVCSAPQTTEIYLDKYLSYVHHERHEIAFAKAFLPSEYNGQFAECIAKPRKGRGSRGLIINPTEWKHFSDEEYMIQDLKRGKEITTGFYITKSNELHGMITFERWLENGATQNCIVTHEFDDACRKIILQIIKHSNIRGAANLQSIVDEKGKIHPFEINCRISGTNSIRSQFGFEDVRYTCEEYLFNTPLSPVNIKKGLATRILMDVIYPEAEDFGAQLNKNSNPYIY